MPTLRDVPSPGSRQRLLQRGVEFFVVSIGRGHRWTLPARPDAPPEQEGETYGSRSFRAAVTAATAAIDAWLAVHRGEAAGEDGAAQSGP
jgi:hypothetical protein